MDNIKENNRLIAEFMDYEHDNYEGNINSITYHCKEHLINVSGLEPWNTTADDWESWLRSDEMEFHSSWDWLIPVVEKILEIASDNDYMEQYYQILDCMPRIEGVFNEIIDFIKWYNENK